MATTLTHIPGTVGVDEAGRGPLAGPVVACAVLLPEVFVLEGLDDSKKVSKERRETLAREIEATCEFSVAFVDIDEIETLNILWASMLAMEIAISRLKCLFSAIYIDGDRIPKKLVNRAEAIIGGDGKFACIAAASIVAKVARDAHMTELATHYPEYGFDRHFGYATPEHLVNLTKYGPCPIHRRSFAPVAALIEPKSVLETSELVLS